MSDTVPMERLLEVAPQNTNGHKPAVARSTEGPRLLVGDYLRDNGRKFTIKEAGDRTIYSFDCPFVDEHKGEANITQFASGALSAGCFHNSCASRKWVEFKAAIGAPRPEHFDPPLQPT